MMRSLVFKLSVAFLLVSLIGIALVAFFAGRVSTSEFNNFANAQSDSVLMDQLVNYYEINGSWENLDRVGIGGVGPNVEEVRPFTVVDAQGEVVLGGLGQEMGNRVPRGWLNRGVRIEVDGDEVGQIIFNENRARGMVQAPRNDFTSRVNRAIFLAALGATAVSLVIGVLLARSLIKPLQEITRATQAVAQGDLKQQVPVRSDDELGKLATSFNQMSADLAQSRDLRRQMTADIAHDLRTPLSLILGHAEALSDGVLPPTPETFDVIHDEARRLNRLVEDLRTLSLADAGQLSLHPFAVAPQDLLEHAALVFAPQAEQKGVALQLDIPPDLPAISVDLDRIVQVLGNLVSNALRHTPAGGVIRLAAQGENEHLLLQIQDTGAGIAPEDWPHVFDRFYRGDKARSEGGESGLGLAIARSIVEAHNGRIRATSILGQGTTFTISLPAKTQ